jgi:hypothetical protein
MVLEIQAQLPQEVQACMRTRPQEENAIGHSSLFRKVQAQFKMAAEV